VAQAVNGATTHYLLDLLAPLPEVIAATQGASSTCYVQVGRLAGAICVIDERGYSIRSLAEQLGKGMGYLENRLALLQGVDVLLLLRLQWR
jgi:hypothetical protein